MIPCCLAIVSKPTFLSTKGTTEYSPSPLIELGIVRVYMGDLEAGEAEFAYLLVVYQRGRGSRCDSREEPGFGPMQVPIILVLFFFVVAGRKRGGRTCTQTGRRRVGRTRDGCPSLALRNLRSGRGLEASAVAVRCVGGSSTSSQISIVGCANKPTGGQIVY